MERIPLGVVITVSFVGPLAVALWGSRRPRDVAWVVLAAVGVSPSSGTPPGALRSHPRGSASRRWTASFRGAYAVLAKRIGSMIPSTQGLTLGHARWARVRRYAIRPSASFNASAASPGVVAAMVGVGVLTALPYLLEFAALQRMATATYGVLVSLEPAFAVVIGVVMLGQHPTPPEVVAVAFVVAASVGASRAAGAAVAADVGDV